MLRQVAWLVVLMTAAPAAAGTMFRLEIGPPVAAGTGSTVTKQFKKNVVLVVRPRACDAPGRVQISGTAEGLVDGARQSISLNLIPVDPVEGVYAALQQWPDRGHWLLQLGPRSSAKRLRCLASRRHVSRWRPRSRHSCVRNPDRTKEWS
jgi:hypothetical protein